jgi:PAS domain S-box-containing protein
MCHADGTPLRVDEYPLTRAILHGETTGAEEYRYRRGDGTETWVELSGAPIRGRAKQVIGGVVAMVDIGDKKLAEQALRGLNETLEARVAERTAQLAASEARFRALIENLPDMIFLARVDPGGEVVFELANPAVSGFLGRPLAELTGQNLSALVNPAAWMSLRERFAQCVASGQIVRFELDMEIAGEPRMVDIILVPMPAPPEAGGAEDAGRLVLSSARDITAQRNTEEALRQAQKMEAVGQLTGGLAHDFNNLLAGIVGSLDLMRRRIEQGRASETGRYIDAALGSADRAAALTHRLLAFSRRQTLDPKPTDVAKLTRAMEELIGRSMGPSITVEGAMAEALWTTLCDPNQLESSLLNLAINARDAMPDGGTLSIQGVNLTLDARAAARAGGMAPGQYVAITVSDTGTGMSPDVLARVFEPFFTTKPLGQGTGLGLSMVYGFARQSGGHVRVESTLGAGTQVRLYLPRHEGGMATEAAQPGSAVALAPPGATTVLVVDDEPVVRLLVVEVLEDLGYGAIQAEDGSEGLRILGTNAQIDLLVTDVGLPGGINGRQLADAARVLRPELKVLFITGYAETAALGNGPLGPGLGVMTKPFALDSLATRIRAMIAP